MTRRLGLIAAIALGALVRVPFWLEALRTPLDGDTAIVGLMARHPFEATTLWGQPYGSPVEAWLAAPWLAVFGATPLVVRCVYFGLGLGLIPLAYALAAALHPAAALPAAVLMACPPPYLLLLAALPAPLYPTTLLLCGALLLLAARGGEPATGRLLVWGTLAGLALWTHLMAATVVLATAVQLWRRAGRRSLLALLPLALASAPWWTMAVSDRWATRIVEVSGRQESFAEHLGEVAPALYQPVAALLGTHVPLVPDDPDHVAAAPPGVGLALVIINGVLLVAAVRSRREAEAVPLLLGTIALVVVAFPLPLRSAAHTVRFLTPLALPLLTLLAWGAARASSRRAWIVVLTLAALHLLGGARLLMAWRATDRASAPFLLPDLAPVVRSLDAHGIRRAYASYGPAWRLCFESGERIIASQPWNERFLHYPLPRLDEVRFAKDVAWVLTPSIPTDLPSPRGFEDALGQIGGAFKKTEAGPAIIYHGFVPPFAPQGEALPGVAGPSATSPTTVALPRPQRLDGVTLLAGPGEPRLLRSMDVEVSFDGTSFETVARRRRREERRDLRWVNGHPQAVIDHDLVAVALGGRTVAAVRITPVASDDAWTLGAVLLHPAGDAAELRPWDEWLDPALGWDARLEALLAAPLREREDWHYRLLLVSRRAGP